LGELVGIITVLTTDLFGRIWTNCYESLIYIYSTLNNIGIEVLEVQ
jgi:hypothetical protein